MGNHSIKDPNEYPKYQQLMTDSSFHQRSENYKVIQCGTAEVDPGTAGVANILNKQMGLRVKGYIQHSVRTITVRLENKLKHIIIIQVYISTQVTRMMKLI